LRKALYRQNAGIDRTIFLATVVQTKGSTYRKAGARMLIADLGKIAGMVSGGCLEQDILCHVQQQTPPYQPFVITYDTTTEEDMLWGFGLGCNGVVIILVENLIACSDNPLTFIADCFDRQQSGILATVFQVEGDFSVPIGARLMLHPNGAIEHNIADVDLFVAIAADAQKALHQHIIHRRYHLPLGQVDVSLEVIQPPPHLTIFGAGRDVLPLAEFAKTLGWRLTIVDCRSSEATADRFTMADLIILVRREEIARQVTINPNTIAVVMTHNYLDDLEILRSLLTVKSRYVGVLGSRQRTATLLNDLEINSEHLQQLHAPIGLDIGAETPEEIAIAIVAEIQAVITDRTAGFLKHYRSSIHTSQVLH
jgi:xanthine dehydrogenase accessory factor